MSLLKSCVHVWHAFHATAFIVLASFFVLSLITLMLPLYPLFPRFIHRRICRLCEWGWIVFLYYGTQSVRYHYHYFDGPAGALPPVENAFVVMNHRGDLDWLIGFHFAHTELRTLSYVKFFVKQSLVYVPLMGYGMLMAGYIFVKRRWESDQRRIRAAFSRMLRLSGKSIPIYLFCFAEGSRLTPEKLAASNEWAKSRKLPEHNWVLHPRTKGFCATLQGLEGKLDAVYDVAVAYENDEPLTLWGAVTRSQKQDVHVLVRRWKIQGIPESEDARASWIYNVYDEKDAALDMFRKKGKFPKSADELRTYMDQTQKKSC
jgi:1-acyl-sn-glycerol-3-phosphate acyltransferase